MFLTPKFKGRKCYWFKWFKINNSSYTCDNKISHYKLGSHMGWLVYLLPSHSQWMLCINCISNVPVIKYDVSDAENFCTDTCSLKWKIVRKRPGSIPINYLMVPKYLLEYHKAVTLKIEIVFINKITSVVRPSMSIKFNASKHVTNSNEITVVYSIIKC